MNKEIPRNQKTPSLAQREILRRNITRAGLPQEDDSGNMSQSSREEFDICLEELQARIYFQAVGE